MSDISLHEQIKTAYNTYIKEIAEFEERGVKIAATRARKALHDLNKLTIQRRKEIQDHKKEM